MLMLLASSLPDTLFGSDTRESNLEEEPPPRLLLLILLVLLAKEGELLLVALVEEEAATTSNHDVLLPLVVTASSTPSANTPKSPTNADRWVVVPLGLGVVVNTSVMLEAFRLLLINNRSVILLVFLIMLYACLNGEHLNFVLHDVIMYYQHPFYASKAATSLYSTV